MDDQCEGTEIAVAGWPGSISSSIVPLVDTTIPNVARIYDYFLGGKDNFAADREAAEELRSLLPDAEIACRENRDFLRRTVRYLASDSGIGQFIDIGSGLPTASNTHE